MLEARFAESLRREQQYGDLETEPLLALPTDQASDAGEGGTAADGTAHSPATYGSVSADREAGAVHTISEEEPRVGRRGEALHTDSGMAPETVSALAPGGSGEARIEAGGTAPDGLGR